MHITCATPVRQDNKLIILDTNIYRPATTTTTTTTKQYFDMVFNLREIGWADVDDALLGPRLSSTRQKWPRNCCNTWLQ
jgi:hypothetical protein